MGRPGLDNEGRLFAYAWFLVRSTAFSASSWSRFDRSSLRIFAHGLKLHAFCRILFAELVNQEHIVGEH